MRASSGTQPELVFLYCVNMSVQNHGKRLLILSVGYGKGHHSAAAALSEYYESIGWQTLITDACAEGYPRCFRLTQVFYDCCVRFLPWLWRVTYDLTDTADWARLVRLPVLRNIVRSLRSQMDAFKPDLVICTYPLFAYVLDLLRTEGGCRTPYAVVVTDAREISRPWMCSDARLFVVPDEGSRLSVVNRYALSVDRVIAAGFPVRRGFRPSFKDDVPSSDKLSVVYGAYRQSRGVERDVDAMFAAFPQLQLTIIAGHRANLFRKRFRRYEEAGRLTVVQATDNMAELLASSHFYIGKAGAATLFECYACMVPILINYTLPGQEQGNLELILEEGVGCHVESTEHLIVTLHRLLKDDASGWRSLRGAMKTADRTSAVNRIAMAINQVFGV